MILLKGKLNIQSYLFIFHLQIVRKLFDSSQSDKFQSVTVVCCQFESISVGDKTALLKKNMTEMCHLRGAIRFDVTSNNFVWYFSKKDELQMTFQKSNTRG